jgi:anthranilate phosphoribosyltransferase
MKDVLNKLFEHKNLSKEEAKETLLKIGKGEVNPTQIASLLTVFLMRSISVDELSGFRSAMLEMCLPVDFSEFDAIDVCGTGGDSKNTFNISTLSAFVAAGAGVQISKHGNYAVSSASGSSNLLEYAGVKFTNDISKLKISLEKSNVAVLHAPLFHPAMKNVAPIRKELGIKTFFNILGPTINPSFPQKQLTGVFNLALARLYGHLFYDTFERFAIVHSLDGYDEVSLTSPFKMVTHESEVLLEPLHLNLPEVQQANLYGGDSVAESFGIFKNILDGNGTDPQKAVIAANAGLAIWVAKGKGMELAQCIDMAKESLASGKAKECFGKFLTYNS